MNQLYWIFEYVKVLLAYLFILYLWPTVVFRPLLRGKGRTYRFCFCVNISILLFNAVVMLLGLVHLLNQTLVAVLFWGAFVIQLFRNFHPGLGWLDDIRSVLGKTMTTRRMLLKWHMANTRRLGGAIRRWWDSTKNRRIEYALLFLITLFAMAYFSFNALQVHSYGFGDQYVHHAWIYDMTQGKVFSAGIYPEGMHSFIYLMGSVLPIRFYSIILFLAGIHIMVFVVSVYLLGSALFHWRMSGLFALVGFLTVEQVVVNGVTGISRFAWTIPQEFALYTVFLSAYGLLNFLRREHGPLRLRTRAGWKELFSDRDLLIFGSSLGASVCVHFYATILAAFVCLIIVLLHLRRLFRPASLSRLAAAVVIALLIAGIPMGVAALAGYPLQSSLDWAMAGAVQYTDETEDAEASEPEEKAPVQTGVLGQAEKVIRKTYFELYGKERGRLLLWLDLGTAGFSVLMLILLALFGLGKKRRKKEQKRFTTALFKGYLIIALMIMILFIAYRPALLGLPTLIAGERVCSCIDVFSMLLFACVPDLIFTVAGCVVKEPYLKPVSAIVCVGIYVFAQMSGLFHGFLYYELTRYPVAVELTKELVNHLPERRYTIISSTDELYQVAGSGYHEEWADLLERSGDETYTIPTPYLVFFIEKQPIDYAQNSFASGPSWLAAEKYVRLYRDGVQYPEILHSQVSPEAAASDYSDIGQRFELSSELDNRTILESRAYAWYQQFSSIYPNEGEILYEDEDFLCYCVHQNEFSLFSLGVMGD